MSTPQALNASLLRPCVLHILRAAGYHSTRPSVLDTLTGLAANFMTQLAHATAAHAALNHDDPELALEPMIQDVRMAMQDFGLLIPERGISEQQFDGEEDTRGVDTFIAWATGPENKQIRRIALDGAEGVQDDYLTVLKKKHNIADEDSRYIGTVLGKPAEPRAVKIEGADFTSVSEWAERIKEPDTTEAPLASSSVTSSRRQSSVLSSLGDESMGSMEF